MTYTLKYSSILTRSASVWTDATHQFWGVLSFSRIFTIFWLLLCTKTIDCSTSKCQVCKDIVKEFNEGIRKTSKSNFGGGNTHWEEKSLGSYATSETRLVEIMEGLCEHSEKECHTMVEAHEEILEKYWFAFFAKKKDKDLHLWFCIENIKVCCPDNTFGPNCDQCPGDPKNPCRGNGKCDGEGSREGTGKCTCNAGYKGDLCDECTDGYYEESKNQTHTSCKACHESCKTTCWEAGPKGCDECKNGWTHSEEEGCVDVNECEKTPCEENEYCLNNDGSYSCAKCHSACDRCRGYGADNCEECKDGYELKDSLCTDKDECAAESSPCTGNNETCVNTLGSYSCSCQEGFIRDNEECIPKPKDSPPPSSSSSTSSSSTSSSSKPKTSSRTKQENGKKKQRVKKDYANPGFLELLSALGIFILLGILVQGNLFFIGILCGFIGAFLYWFGSQHDKL